MGVRGPAGGRSTLQDWGNISLGIAGCKFLGKPFCWNMLPKRRTKGARWSEAATMKAQLVSVSRWDWVAGSAGEGWRWAAPQHGGGNGLDLATAGGGVSGGWKRRTNGQNGSCSHMGEGKKVGQLRPLAVSTRVHVRRGRRGAAQPTAGRRRRGLVSRPSQEGQLASRCRGSPLTGGRG